MKGSSRTAKNFSSPIKQFIVIVSLIAMFLFFSFLFIKKYFSTPHPVVDAQGAVVRVAELIQLPNGSVHVSRVETPNLLREVHPTLYSNVQLGDYILEYETMLIIYRPREDRIVLFVNK